MFMAQVITSHREKQQFKTETFLSALLEMFTAFYKCFRIIKSSKLFKIAASWKTGCCFYCKSWHGPSPFVWRFMFVVSCVVSIQYYFKEKLRHRNATSVINYYVESDVTKWYRIPLKKHKILSTQKTSHFTLPILYYENRHPSEYS